MKQVQPRKHGGHEVAYETVKKPFAKLPKYAKAKTKKK